MVYQGTIQNGVIVLAGNIRLPEGAPVRVELVNSKHEKSVADENDDALLNMTKFAVDMGIPDLSTNIDHYLYGHPKASDGK
jgi:hypothetical protein